MKLRVYNEAPEPEDVEGIPHCWERCRHNDGKRCRLMGLRTPIVCTPALEEIIAERDSMRDWEAKICMACGRYDYAEGQGYVYGTVDQCVDAITDAMIEVQEQRDSLTAQPIDDWSEEDGPVLWWRFPVSEPPYVGTPLDSDWPGYHTHWTRIHVADEPWVLRHG